jgi:hypothetical protein
LITAGTLIWHFTMLAGPRRDDDGVWLLAGFALGWALVSVLRGEARRDPRPQMVEGDPAFHALSRSALRPSSARRAWEAASPARRAFFDRATALVRQPSVLIRGLLVFLIFYGGSALLVATGVEPLSGIILSFAGALPGAVDVPTHDQPAALAYWLSYGMLPALLLTLAGLPWWSRSPP